MRKRKTKLETIDLMEDEIRETVKKKVSKELQKGTTNMRRICYMKLEKETKGTVQYKEVSHQGDPVPIIEAKIGVLYVRKTTLKNKAAPGTIKVTIESVED